MADIEQQISQLSEKLDTKHVENVTRLIQMEANTKQLNEYVETLHRSLFGNGQPGVITTMSARITELEKWTWRALGAGFVVMNVLQWIKK